MVKVLNDKGIYATLDHLGEHTTNLQEAERATQDLIELLCEIERSGVRSNISLKLTQIGLAVDEAACIENLVKILAFAKERGFFVRLDMEDAPWVDTTLKICNEMRARGFDNVGVVIQAYLYRSAEDIWKLEEIGTRIRLCKGAYQEPVSIAFAKKRDTDANYDTLASMLIDWALINGSPESTPDGKFPPIPAIASHDVKRIEFAKAYAAKAGLKKEALEFQMLYGIRRDLQEQLAQEGYPVRVYVPYGTEWYPYYMRRLAERPANIWFFISNFFKG
jgi:proline dehydrogenase